MDMKYEEEMDVYEKIEELECEVARLKAEVEGYKAVLKNIKINIYPNY